MTNPPQRSLFGDEPEPVNRWEYAAAREGLTAEVVFNIPVEGPFHYRVPEALAGLLRQGQRVRAPFGQGNRDLTGFCVAVGTPPPGRHKLKSLAAIVDEQPLVDTTMLQLTRWIAEHYLCTWGTVLESVVPLGVKKAAGTRVMKCYRLVENADTEAALSTNVRTAKQLAVLDALRNADGPVTARDLKALAECGDSPLATLERDGIIEAVRLRKATHEFDELPAENVPDQMLTADQSHALTVLHEQLELGTGGTVLLHGVTGSGKTEVYIQAIREVVSYGRQAIVLVPEISLTPQTIRRFRSRFPQVAVLHSHQSDSERHRQWQRISRGEVQVVVGARSAVFAPTPHLGLIVIDEEHETSFKQETAPRYHAREVARKRCQLEGVPLLLGSATPTLESWQRARSGQDVLVSLPKRVGDRPLPPVVIVDTRNDPQVRKGAAIGRVLDHGIRNAIADNGQVILFLNLRGYAPTLWCRSCGTAVRCPHCDVTLTWHRDRKVALCHVCEHEETVSTCATCQPGNLSQLGVGTQRLEVEVRRRFPDINCLRMDSDSMKKHGSYEATLDTFRRGEAQLLLGTQMIAKGLDFPNVTLVGVIDADTSLHQPDLRASERTFQLIAQVAGRTGRSSRGGRVFVQTASPAEPAITLAAQHDYLAFAKYELATRKALEAPPFTRLARLIVRGDHEELVREHITCMADLLRAAAVEFAQTTPVRILGPAPAPLARVKDQYRYHLQMASESSDAIRAVWRSAAEQFPRNDTIEFVIDVDPLSMR